MAAIEGEFRKRHANANRVRRLAYGEWTTATLFQISDPGPIAA
jgi:hypothetical protein